MALSFGNDFLENLDVLGFKSSYIFCFNLLNLSNDFWLINGFYLALFEFKINTFKWLYNWSFKKWYLKYSVAPKRSQNLPWDYLLNRTFVFIGDPGFVHNFCHLSLKNRLLKLILRILKYWSKISTMALKKREISNKKLSSHKFPQ